MFTERTRYIISGKPVRMSLSKPTEAQVFEVNDIGQRHKKRRDHRINTEEPNCLVMPVINV